MTSASVILSEAKDPSQVNGRLARPTNAGPRAGRGAGATPAQWIRGVSKLTACQEIGILDPSLRSG